MTIVEKPIINSPFKNIIKGHFISRNKINITGKKLSALAIK